MLKISGNLFNCLFPIVFLNRYVVAEKGAAGKAALSVVVGAPGNYQWEVRRNQPQENTFSKVTTNPTGIITVSTPGESGFLYKIRPGSSTSVVFGRWSSNEMAIHFFDAYMEVTKGKGSERVSCVRIDRFSAIGNVGVAVEKDERIILGGGSVPPDLIAFVFSQLSDLG